MMQLSNCSLPPCRRSESRRAAVKVMQKMALASVLSSHRGQQFLILYTFSTSRENQGNLITTLYHHLSLISCSFYFAFSSRACATSLSFPFFCTSPPPTSWTSSCSSVSMSDEAGWCSMSIFCISSSISLEVRLVADGAL